MSDPAKYTVGWICAISTEFVAALEVLDEEHEGPSHVADRDNNTYALGKIGNHNVVIATLPDGQYGLCSAATVARDMLHSFHNIRTGLMVGIGGGAPSAEHDIRLGDIVVSSPGHGKGGVFQYDFGKLIQGQPFQQTGHLNQPPTILSSAVSKLKANHKRRGNEIHEAVTDIISGNRRLRREYSRPDPNLDQLYRSSCLHNTDRKGDCSGCGDSPSQLVHRENRDDDDDVVAIHYGLIASANALMKDANVRDTLANNEGVLCFEMEAAGLMNHFPCLVIRGICDYSDSHKNDKWQGFAAMAASVYAKQLLSQIAPTRLEMERKILEYLDDFQEQMQRTESGLLHVKGVLENSDLDKWLHSPDPSINFNHALQQREHNTGLWFLHSRSFANWKVESKSFLWLHGIPGCGKTILSATIIDHLKRCLPNNHPILYFYCDFNAAAKQTLENIIRSFIHQLYYQHTDSRQFLNNLFSAHNMGKTQPSRDELCNTFTLMIQHVPETWIILDAVDECTTRKGSWTEGILAWLDHMQRQEECNIHFLITSRPEQDITAKLGHLTGEENVVRLQSDVIGNDIHAYIQRRVREDDNLKRWRRRPDIQQEIESTLMEKVNGMFRWAACQLDALEDCLDPPSLAKALQSLPKTLDDTYDQIFQSIPEEHHENARKILQILAFSERPLQVIELADALAVDVSHKPYFNPENRMPDPCEISRYCSSLVVMVTVPHDPGDQFLKNHADGDKVIQLAHFSVKEYLTSSRAMMISHTSFNEPVAKAFVATTSVAYLLAIDPNLPESNILDKFPFANYAARYWIGHAAIPREKDDKLHELIMELFFVNGTSYKRWLQLHDPDDIRAKHKKGLEHPPCPIYYASSAGLLIESAQLALSGTDVNAKGGFYGNALQVASYQGHRQIVEMLLKHGADVNIRGGFYGSALQAASLKGHQQIVEILLNHGADVNAEGGYMGTPLQAASYEGHWPLVDILLKHGADVNGKGGKFGNPLQAASFKGHQQIVEILLMHGADVNAEGGHFLHAFPAACHSEHKGTVKTLLRHGADVDSEGGTWGNGLKWAIGKGGLEMMEMLLSHGADVNSVGSWDGWTPLHTGSFTGDVERVRLLLEKGADITVRDHAKQTALYKASQNGYVEVVKLLLEKGADITVRNEHGQTPLHLAILDGHLEVVKLLLDRGADIPVSDYGGQTLYLALERGYIEIVKILIEKGADITACNHSGHTVLHLASERGYVEVVKLLLEKRKEVDLLNHNGSTPLHLAMYNGQTEIAQQLLDKGADVNIKNKDGWTILHAASYHGRMEIVKKLLINGADSMIQNSHGWTPLHAASFRGWTAISGLLLEQGIDINIENKDGWTALHEAAHHGHLQTAILLLENGAEVDWMDQMGRTALHLAIYSGRAEVTKYLLQKGADVSLIQRP